MGKKSEGTGKTHNLTSGAVFWNFEEHGGFKGRYMDEVHSQDEEGKLIGFTFADEDSELWVIGNNYAIDRALNTDLRSKSEVASGSEPKIVKYTQGVFKIDFLGKVDRKAGGTFNRFRIDFEED